MKRWAQYVEQEESNDQVFRLAMSLNLTSDEGRQVDTVAYVVLVNCKSALLLQCHVKITLSSKVPPTTSTNAISHSVQKLVLNVEVELVVAHVS